MSLIIGVIILVPLGLKASSFLGGSHQDKSDELPQFTSLISTLEADKNATRTLRLDAEDLFLFFSTGTGSIILSTDKKDIPSFSIGRPDDCQGKACVCYCKSGPYWKETTTAPHLEMKGIFPDEEYTCPAISCQELQGDIYFTNSRGTDSYLKQLQTSSAIDYVSLPLDVPVLLADHLENEKLFTYFFSLAKGRQLSQFVYLNSYHWKNGFALGAFGTALNSKDQKERHLEIPAVDLRLERKEEGLIGICTQATCIIPDDLERIKDERALMKAQDALKKQAEQTMEKFSSLPSCISSLGSLGNDLSSCLPKRDLIDFLSISYKETSLSQHIEFSISSKNDAGETLITNISFFQGEELLGWVESGYNYSCITQDKTQIHARPFDLSFTLDTEDDQGAIQPLFGIGKKEDGVFCDVSITKE